jgi:hypothetical protein
VAAAAAAAKASAAVVLLSKYEIALGGVVKIAGLEWLGSEGGKAWVSGWRHKRGGL